MFRTFQGGFHSFGCHRIGPGNDQGFFASSGIQSGFQLTGHFTNRDDRFVPEVATTFGKILIFQLDRRGTTFFKKPHSPLGIDGIAVSSVGIDNQGEFTFFPDQAHCFRNFGHRYQSDVWTSMPSVSQAGTGEVSSIKTGICNHHHPEGITNTRGNEDFIRI